jgi:hypothetical protein
VLKFLGFWVGRLKASLCKTPFKQVTPRNELTLNTACVPSAVDRKCVCGEVVFVVTTAAVLGAFFDWQ